MLRFKAFPAAPRLYRSASNDTIRPFVSYTSLMVPSQVKRYLIRTPKSFSPDITPHARMVQGPREITPACVKTSNLPVLGRFKLCRAACLATRIATWPLSAQVGYRAVCFGASSLDEKHDTKVLKPIKTTKIRKKTFIKPITTSLLDRPQTSIAGEGGQ